MAVNSPAMPTTKIKMHKTTMAVKLAQAGHRRCWRSFRRQLAETPITA